VRAMPLLLHYRAERYQNVAGAQPA